MHLQGGNSYSQSITRAQPTNSKSLNSDYTRVCLILLLGIVVAEVRQHPVASKNLFHSSPRHFYDLFLKLRWMAAPTEVLTKVAAYLDFRNGSTLLWVHVSPWPRLVPVLAPLEENTILGHLGAEPLRGDVGRRRSL